LWLLLVIAFERCCEVGSPKTLRLPVVKFFGRTNYELL
jgi:hypothetical protein